MIAKFAERYDVASDKVFALVGSTIFRAAKQEDALTPEETVAALIVCNAYDLNPFTKEIYAFRSKGKLLIVVGVDGWAAIVNRQTQLNGIEFDEHFDDKGIIRAVTCKIHRKDCALPVVVTEYTHECRRDTIPWNTMPIRMTRNRAFVQCARVAFSISGIVDDDEARTIEGSPEFAPSETRTIIDQSQSKSDAVKSVVRRRAQQVEGNKQEPSAAAPPQTTTATTQSTAQQTSDGPQPGTQEKSDPSPAQTGTGENPDAEPVGDLFEQQTQAAPKPGPALVDKPKPAAPPPVDESGW
jgi:phage recombination protein Bet